MYLKNYDYNIFLFTPNREEIYKKVDRRFLKMIDKGVIEEVKKLLSLKLNTSLPIMKAHGVPEISDYLSGSINLEECIAKTQQVTRNYVKRQLTWWKSSKLNIHTVFEQFASSIDLKLINF
jgi:tRNA dimethylallyltransferase